MFSRAWAWRASKAFQSTSHRCAPRRLCALFSMVSTGLNPPDYLYINILRAKTVWQREEEKIMADIVIATPDATASRFRNAGLWVLQIAGAAMFFMAGTPKLTRAENMIQVFAAVGLGQWLRYFTGTLEVLGAVALL